jgi:hypothetical protein
LQESSRAERWKSCNGRDNHGPQDFGALTQINLSQGPSSEQATESVVAMKQKGTEATTLILAVT